MVDERALERELRAHLERVGLVCEAAISGEQVDAAEHVVRPQLSSPSSYDRLARHSPATLVTYFVRRGAAVYDRNGLWERLGVVEYSSRAGQAFLKALHTLGLRDFEEETTRYNARRYVAPILVHGALPANVSTKLIETVEDELRRGVVDGAEVRQRLIRRQDRVQLLGRPAARLLEWCPTYAAQLLDTVIDLIEHPDGAALAKLPLHMREALSRDTERRKGLRRLRVPTVEFDWWSGIGPQISGVDGATWVLRTNGLSTGLRPGEHVELLPDAAATLSGAGRSIDLWHPEPATFFDLGGQPIARAADLPTTSVAVMPRGWRLWTLSGDPIEEAEEGSVLTGAWTGYRSFVVDLMGHRDVVAGPAPDDRRVSRTVGGDTAARLVGPICPTACTSDGRPLFTAAPMLEVPGRIAPLRVRVRPDIGVPYVGTIEHDPDRGHFAVGQLLPDGPTAGVIEVLDLVGGEFPFAVVPDLEIDRPTNVLLPESVGSIDVRRAQADGTMAATTIPIPAHDATVALALPGIPENLVIVPLPRLLWSLRSATSARLRFADGAIRIAAAELVAEPMWLLVRSGVSTMIGATLVVDGRPVRSIAPRATVRSSPAAHHRSFALDDFRDTIRAHADAHLELRLTVDDESIPAVECGDTPVRSGQRRWDPLPTSPRRPDRSVLERVEWLRGNNAAASVSSDRTLFKALQEADTPDAVVTFLRRIGHQQHRWSRAEFPSGPSAVDWQRFDDVADALWRIRGIRHREFAGDEIERLRRWGGTRGERCRKAPDPERHAMQYWLLSTRPDRRVLQEWRHGHLVEAALPARRSTELETISETWLPGTVLYHVMCLVGGDQLAGPYVEEAVELVPELALEAVAAVLEVLHRGWKIIHPPVLELDEDNEPQPEDRLADDSVDEPEMLSAPASLDECTITIADGRIALCTEMPVARPVIRLSTHGRPAALLFFDGDSTRWEATLPLDLGGTVGIELVDDRVVPSACRVHAEVDLQEVARSADRSLTRIESLDALQAGRLDHLVMRIVELAGQGVLPTAQVEELFDDERLGSEALMRARANGVPEEAFRLALLACTPTAMLFSSLGVAPAALRSDPLAFAVLGPRSPAAWQTIGWPNAQTFHSGRTWTELSAFIQRRVPRTAGDPPRTARYAPGRDYPNPGLVDRVVAQLDTTSADRAFVDLVVAAHRMLNVDRLTGEALRLLLELHHDHPALVAGATIGGIALTLATTT